MKLGLFGGGFKPFTTGHFAKLADAIRDNDRTILFYGMQQSAGTKQQKLRKIGSSGMMYNEQIAQSIFEIYKEALERIPGVEVVPIYSQAVDNQGNPLPIRSPVGAIFNKLEDYVSNPELYEKVTVYGDKSSMAPYMRSPTFKEFTRSGRIQFGGAIPENPDDYIDKLDDLMVRGEEEARDALKAFYASKGQDMTDEEIEDIQTVRGTRVRDLASTPETSEQAKRYLPPFLDDDEKDKIIKILTGENLDRDIQAESQLRHIIRGFIRG